MEILKGLTALPLTIVASVVLIFLGIIYFVIALLIVWFSADLVLKGTQDPNWVLLVAGLITSASLLGAAIQKED